MQAGLSSHYALRCVEKVGTFQTLRVTPTPMNLIA